MGFVDISRLLDATMIWQRKVTYNRQGDRSTNEEDWVRREIVFALQHKKNIISIMLRGFVWPEGLPREIAEIQ